MRYETVAGLGCLLLLFAVATQAKAQIFPLSTQPLPPGTYVVTPEGYWPVQAWVAAHPGKARPASVIVVQEQPQPPQVTVKTKTVHEHHKDKDHRDDKCRFRHECPPPPPPPTGGGSSGGGGSSSSGGGGSSD